MDLAASALELQELRTGLLQPLPRLPARYFYDDEGARLFDLITQQPEYYPTRTEVGILRAHADDIVARVQPSELVELGSGAGIKIQLVLDAMQRADRPLRCVLLDINQGWLDNSAEELARRYPGIQVEGRIGDFTRDLRVLGHAPRRLVLFLAGTFGNLNPQDEAPAMLRRVADAIQPDGALLLGVDLVKDPAVLEAAYNDAAGVTAAFNRNMLSVVNDRFGADFDLDAFRHRAFYDPDNAWIEMRLVATRQTQAFVPGADVQLTFAPGDELRTELSCKYTRPRVQALADTAGLKLDAWHTDADQRFALALLRP